MTHESSRTVSTHSGTVDSQEIKIAFKIKILSRFYRMMKPINHMTVDELSAWNDRQTPRPVARLLFGKSIKQAKVVNQSIETRHGHTPVRIYHPLEQDNPSLIVFFHGGGWATGNLDTHDRMCRRIAHGSGAVLVSVGYRLAPWHKYPTAAEECYDAILWAAQNAAALGADGASLFVMGDSAGGNLAAVACHKARDLCGPDIQGQVLIYPTLDGTLAQPSMDRYARAPILTKALMAFFVNHYARDQRDIREPGFSPLLADDLRRLPPALVITAQYDPLHDDGLAYANRLKAAGNSVQHSDYAGMVHAFLLFPGFCTAALAAYREICTFVKPVSSAKKGPGVGS